MTQIITGERFVGQRAAEAKRDAEFERRFARGAEVDRFDDPDHLVQYHANLMASEAEEQARRKALREYIQFWAGEKRREIESHKARGCYLRCETCFLCLTCRNAVGQRWRCVCSDGKKFLSPDRIVFINGSAKRHWTTTIWEVGRGYTPRQIQAEKFSLGAHGLDDRI